jgi:hypothetical protein
VRAALRSASLVVLALGAAQALVHCSSFGSSGSSGATANEAAPATDATDASDGASPRFCASLSPQPKHCWDFDDGDLRAGWTGFESNPPDAGLTFEVDNQLALSPPFSARLTTPLNAPLCSSLRVGRMITGSFTTVQASSSIRVEAADGGGPNGVAVMLLVVQDGTRTVVFYVTVGRDQSYVQEQFDGDGGQMDKIYPLPSLPLRSWRNFAFTLTLPKTATMLIDGAPAVSFVLAQPLAAQATSVDFSIGAHCLSSDAHATELRFDNVILDTQ